VKNNKSPARSTLIEPPPGATLNQSRARKEAPPSPTLNPSYAHKRAVPQHAGPDRAYFTSDANCDVTSVISTPGAVQEHVIYSAYGIATFTNSSWSSSADTLAVRTGWQGGESMSWIVGWSFQNRIELANLNVWMTADPIMAGSNYLPMLDLPHIMRQIYIISSRLVTPLLDLKGGAGHSGFQTNVIQ
jgi:hypothetical protein